MATVVLTNTSTSPWMPPGDCPAGTDLKIEAWGAGSGGSGSSTSFRSGGAGGSWSSTNYTVTSGDVTSGIAFSISNGSAGTGAANPSAGPDTSFGTAPKNIIPNSINYGAVVSGALPAGWSSGGVSAAPTVTALGVDGTTGLNYIDLTYNTTTTGTTFRITPSAINTVGNTDAIPMSASLSYTASLWISTTNLTNISNVRLSYDYCSVTGAYITTVFPISSMAPTTTLTHKTGTVTSSATVVQVQPYIQFTVAASGTAVNFTVRLAGVHIEQNASFTSFQATPTAYVLAKGGGAPAGTVAGVGSAPGNSFGLINFPGGGGKNTGGGGGGSAGKDGAGATATTATGATADAGHGGTAGVSNVEGGGGGTASTSAGAGGAPGGGGGANTSTGNGAAGGRGQVRLTWTPPLVFPSYRSRAAILAR